MNVVLSLPPTVNSMYRIGRGRMYKTADAKAWDEEAIYKIKLRKPTAFTGNVGVMIGLYFKDKRRQDADNCLKALLDALTHAGVIKDDSFITDINVTKRTDSILPRCEIEVYETNL